mmetsp:Transcript_13251/g.19788  ORF Transcript_13251/g.19788 Transcript_13251/m.19788 type:complete len:325 (-) Transcript_13251:232-1206(-)
MEVPTNKDNGGGGCPIKHNPNAAASSINQGGGGGWGSWLGIGNNNTNSNAVANTPTSGVSATSDGGGGCPVKHGSSTDSEGKNPFTLPASLEEAARHPQSPLFDQKIPLSTHRVTSSIPRADELRPEPDAPQPSPQSTTTAKHAPHQPASASNWVYPSEQQFYNAMRRKGWEAHEETIPSVVRIHNAVNERGWSEIRRWENELHNCTNPRLVRFLGRPDDTSPKAWINTNLLFYRKPFDRHDWFVDRGDGKEPRRYVIDFYDGGGGDSSDEAAKKSNGLPSMYLDVRPALDDSDAFVDRARMFFREAFPGIVSALEKGSGEQKR